MDQYYVNRNKDVQGDNEVHKEGCRWLPNVENRVSLGNCSNCQEAVRKAKAMGYHNANGCVHCSSACHTS
jgi:hypothetical protein